MTPTEPRGVPRRWPAIVAVALAAACGSEPAHQAIGFDDALRATHPDLDSLERLVDSLAQARDSAAPWFTPRAPQRQTDVRLEIPTLLVFYPDLARAAAASDPEVIVAVHAFRPTLPSLAKLAAANQVVFLERFVPALDESFRIHDRAQRRVFILTVPPDGIGYVLLRPGQQPRVHLGTIPMAEWPAILTAFLAQRAEPSPTPAS